MAKKKKSDVRPVSKKNVTEECVPEQKARDIKIDYEKKPVKSEHREIHSRKLLPALKEGKKVTDETPSPPIKIDK